MFSLCLQGLPDSHVWCCAAVCQVYLPSKGSDTVAVLHALLPCDYPSTAGPVLQLDAPHAQQKQLHEVVKEMEAMFCPGAGNIGKEEQHF